MLDFNLFFLIIQECLVKNFIFQICIKKELTIRGKFYKNIKHWIEIREKDQQSSCEFKRKYHSI